MDRPAAVPDDAEFIEDPGRWGRGPTVDGHRDGRWRFWWPDGTLAEETEFRSGVQHGPAREYHDDGSLAAEAEWAGGLTVVERQFRSIGPTRADTWVDKLPENVKECVFRFDHRGRGAYQRLLDGAGAEVNHEGLPVPPRPAGVPEHADYIRDEELWLARRWEPANGGRVGVGRCWTADGAPHRILYFRDNVAAAHVDPDGEANGNPLIEAARDGDAEAVDELLALGLGRLPGAAWHAALEALPELAARLLADSEPAASTRDEPASMRAGAAPENPASAPADSAPERPGSVPEDAVWVGGLRRWVRGRVDGSTGHAEGCWDFWDVPDGYRRALREFADGRCRVWREFDYAGRVKRERHYDAAGTEILVRKYDDGALASEEQQRPDGTTAHRRFYSGGGLRAERVTRGEDEELVTESWFDEDGTRTAEVTTAIRKGRPAERWHALDADGRITATGRLRAGPRGGPVGKWRLLAADGSERATVKFAPLRVGRREDLGALAEAVYAWREMPMPPELAGVAEVPWAKLRTWFGSAKHFPFLLKGLAAADRIASLAALQMLFDPILHQNTISEAAGPAFRYLAALAGAVRDPDTLLNLMLFLLDIATRGGDLGAAHHIKRVHRELPAGTKKPVKFFHANDVEGAYHEVYTVITDRVPTWAEVGAAGSAQVRRCADHLLMLATGEPAAQALRDRIGAETDPLALAELLVGLALHDPAPQTRAILETHLASGDPLTRFAAALTWVRGRLEPADVAVPILLDGLIEEPDDYGAVYLGSGDATSDAATTLALLPAEQAATWLADLCAVLDKTDPLNAISVAGALLDIVFPDEPHTGEPLTTAQRTVIEAIVAADTPWTFNVNLHEVLDYNGLPTDRDQLRALAHGNPVTHSAATTTLTAIGGPHRTLDSFR